MTTIGTLTEVWRYPVKSLVGEMIDAVDVDRRGVRGDRLWAVTDPDGKLGSGKSTRRFRRMDGLLELTASHDPDLCPVVGFPDGRHVPGGDPRVHEALSEHVGRPVRLRRERRVSHLDEGPLHLVTTATLGALARHHGGDVAAARLRPNFVVDVGSADGFVEDGWVGATLGIGDELVVGIRERMPRCVMVEMSQHGLASAPGLLDTVARHNHTCAGVVADVIEPGRITRSDPVRRLA